MDAVELAIPAVVVEGIVGSRVKEVDAVWDTERISSAARSSIDRCSSLACREDQTILNASKLASCGSIIPNESLSHSSQANNIRVIDSLDQLKYRGSDRALLSNSLPDSVHLQQKPGKIARSVSGRSKRQRVANIEDLSIQGGHNDANAASDLLGSYPTKCELPEKSQLIKQKSNLNGKRGDKRNIKISSKSKCESFSAKAGLRSFTSPAGGSSILGLYGLKSDNPDVTKHIDDLPLTELLDGSYKSPGLGKDKVKRAANGNENFLQSIKKACSVLELRSPVKFQMFSETDSSSSMIMSPCPSAVSCVPSSTCNDKEDTDMKDLFAHNKDLSKNIESPANILDFSLLQLKDVLNQLALPPSKDLESLLLDAAKPATVSRNSVDSRSGKLTTNKACLPPFPWSHAYSGHLKTNSDAAKLSSSRITCQGRWERIDNTASLLGVVNDKFTDLKSITYNHSLVPSQKRNSDRSEFAITPSLPIIFPQCEVGASFSRLCSEDSLLPTDPGGNLMHEAIVDEEPSTVLAAAQILAELAKVQSSKHHNPREMTKLLNKPSRKSMKTRKLKFIEKPDEFSDTLKLMPCNTKIKNGTHIMPSKKLKLSNYHVDIKSPINWLAPKSHRSSPSGRSIRDLKNEAKHHNGNTVKQESFMLPPAAKVREKPRKVIQIEWNRAKEKNSLD